MVVFFGSDWALDYRIGVTAAYDNYRDRTDASALIQRLTPAGNRRTFVLLLAAASWGTSCFETSEVVSKHVLRRACRKRVHLEVPLWLHIYEGLQQQLHSALTLLSDEHQ